MRMDQAEQTDNRASGLEKEPQFDDQSRILKARIALLSTAIGGPDHSSDADPAPYKIGDDCLACLKDLKRWFKLVDERQNRWDVAAAAAQYKILTDDLVPIMVNWENLYSAAARKARKNGGKQEDYLKNKEYHDKIALNVLQLMVLMTWPLILTDQSTQNQVEHHSRLKKSQVIYKKTILSVENGKVLKAAVRLAVEIIKVEKRLRSAKDNVVLRLVLNFLRNVAAIEPSDLTLSNKKSLSKGINVTDMLPPNITKNDISLSAVIEAFHRNKVLGLLLTLSNSINQEFDAAFISVPLLEVMFFLVKNVNHAVLYRKKAAGGQTTNNNILAKETANNSLELSGLLQKEHEMKKNVIRNTSTRHSRFGTMLSIQTSDHQRLTVSGGQNLLNSDYALKKLDSRKKWNKRTVMANETVEGLPSSFLSFDQETVYWDETTCSIFRKFTNDFIRSGFNSLLSSATDYFTTEDDKMVTVHQIEYLLFYSWFLKYSRIGKQVDVEFNFEPISFAFKDTPLILVGQLLRKAMEHKLWAVVHAGMIAYTELLSLLESMSKNEDDKEAKEQVKNHLCQEERLKLLSSIPRTASSHSLSYKRGCINLIHVLLKLIETTSKEQQEQSEKSALDQDANTLLEQAKELAKDEGVELEEALELLDLSNRKNKVNFKRTQRSFANENTIKTYITYLENFRELTDDDIKKCIQFLYRIFIAAEEESLLYRIDFMILLKDMLSPIGLPTMSRARKHVTKFADVFMLKLKERLVKSPSWFVGILFPAIHDREAGYYQKYGETMDSNRIERVAPPSNFRITSDLEGMSEAAILDFKFGIVVSALIDREKQDCVEVLRDNLRRSCAIMKSWLLEEVLRESNGNDGTRERFETSSSTIEKAIHRDSDFRALLKLCGYQLTRFETDSCYLSTTCQIADLENSVNLIVKHLTTPFDTPNGEPSSFYLELPNSGVSRTPVGGASYEERLNGNSDAENIGEQETDYFHALNKGSSSNGLYRETANKGTAIKKKKSVRKKQAPDDKSKKTRKARDAPSSHNASHANDVYRQREVTSAEIISDSDDSDDDSVQAIFYENEMFMRFLLDKYQGSLPEHKFIQFGSLAAERMNNNGKLINDYTSLFDGPVPSPKVLGATEQLSGMSLAPRVAEIIEAQDAKDLDIGDFPADIGIDKPESGPTPDTSEFEAATTTKERATEESGPTDPVRYKRRKIMRIEEDDEDD
ncbi:LAME_0G02146g1_1 [Lachancea meyersii CBS 8951]|uniref:Topoisomerase 1-associated factor 1 n=1 Tax=Lachancea meyersii CBS 8951 TaxID=1266667 RepID=A0A1G4K5T8_9SACH|nr:LAME_0G02146g1_1 [Lachancea meyersii CBS 8951]